MAITEPVRNKQQVKELTDYYLRKGSLRNYVLIVLGIHTALRVSDLLRVRWKDVYDFKLNRVRASIHIVEKKTKKPKLIALNKEVIRALSLYASQKAISPDMILIENTQTRKAISRIQAYRVIRAAADALGLGCVSCHSLRKTFGYHSWKGGVSLAVIMDIYNHSSFAVTQRYLGITQDDKNDAYIRLDFSA